MIQVKKNESDAEYRRMYFHCVDATDGMTPETGEAGGQPQIGTRGGAFGDAGIGVLVHMGNGRYYAELTQAAVNIPDRSVIEGRYKSANTAEALGTTVQIVENVVADLRVRKNTALANFTFPMRDQWGNPLTGLTVTAQRSIDGAAFGACANPVSEIANGLYKISLAAADLNGDVIALKFTATGARQRDFTIITES
jgi:hypothetical protein